MTDDRQKPPVYVDRHAGRWTVFDSRTNRPVRDDFYFSAADLAAEWAELSGYRVASPGEADLPLVAGEGK